MKKILFLLLLTLSFTALSSGLDGLVGKYTSYKYKHAEVVISKVLTAQATLFEPAKYEYQIRIDSGYIADLPTIGGEYDYDKAMKISSDGSSLYLDTKEECDDPDCYYFDEINISVNYSRKGQPYLKVSSYGFKLEGEEEEQEFESEYLFYKN